MRESAPHTFKFAAKKKGGQPEFTAGWPGIFRNTPILMDHLRGLPADDRILDTRQDLKTQFNMT